MKNEGAYFSRVQQTVLFFLLLAGFVSSSYSQNNWLPFTSSQKGPSALSTNSRSSLPEPSMSIVDEGEQGVEFDYQFPGAQVSGNDVDGIMYQLLHVDQFSKLNTPGKPALPARWFTIAVPDGMTPKIEILDVNTVVFSGYTVRPALEPAFDYIGAPEPEFKIDRQTYNTDANYPEAPVSISDIKVYRGKSLAKIQVCPILHNPAQKKLTAYSRLHFRVVFEKSSNATSADKQFTPHHSALLSNYVGNPEGITSQNQLSEKPIALSQLRGGLLILTTPTYVQAADTLALWKRLMGYEVSVISRSDWTSTRVRDSVHTRYAAGGTPLEFCVILGDHPDVPSQSSSTGPYTHVTDLFYACMDGPSDFTPDIGIGRISVSSAAEAMTVIQKIVNYERSPVTDPSFYSSGLAAAYFQHASGGYAERRFAQTSWEIRQYLLSQGYAVDREFVTGSSVNPTNWNNGYYSSGEPIPTYLQKPNYAWDGDAAGISAAINDGRFLVSHRDHGGQTLWGDPYYTISHINALSNGDKLPVVLSINCLTGKFDYSSVCFSEAFLRHPAGGAVGVVCATEVSMSGQNDGLAAGIIDGIWSDPGLVPSFPHNTNPSVTPQSPIYHMGLVLNHAKMRMSETWNGGSTPFNYEQYTYELFHFLGDPSMQIWTAEPADISVAASNAIMIGQSNYTIADATCSEGVATLLFQGAIIGKCTLTDGGATMTLDPVPMTTGTATLTITSHNHRPYRQTIDVIPGGDAIFANAPAAGTLFDVGETITVNWETFGSIPHVNVEFSDNGGTSYTPLASSIANTNTYTFSAPAAESDACIVRISDTDGDPHGLTAEFSIHELGTISGTVSGSTAATVYYSGPFTGSVLTDASGVYEISNLLPGTYSLYAEKGGYQSGTTDVTIPPDATVNFTIDYPQISLSPSSLSADLQSGEIDTIDLVVTNEGNAVLEYTVSGATVVGMDSQVKEYDLSHFVELSRDAVDTREGYPVTENNGGPDSFGYTWIDSDEPTGPEFVWHDISGSGTVVSGATGCGDCYDDVPLQWPFELYGVEYDTAWVTTKGYLCLSMGTYQYSNYPLPSSSAPGAIICAFWDDLSTANHGTVYVSQNDNEIVFQWDDIHDYGSSPESYTFQIVLKRNGEIYYYYKTMDGSTLDATVGLQNHTEDDGLTIAYNTAYISDSLAVRISTSPDWLSITKNSGIVAPGGYDTFSVIVSAMDMEPGTFIDSLSVTHNAPQPPVAVPCTLVVDGIKRLASSVTTFDFGNRWIGLDSTTTIALINAGTEPTTVNALSVDNEVFTLAGPSTPFTVASFGQVDIPLTFSPVELGERNATITIQSDAEDNPLISIPVTGTGTTSPTAELSPLTLNFSLTPNAMPADQTSVLSNTGGDDLSWQISSVSQTTSPIDVGDDPKTLPVVDLKKVYDENNYEHPFVPGRVIVGFEQGARSFADATVLSDIGAESVRELGKAINPKTGEKALKHRAIVLVKLADDSKDGVLSAIERLRRDPGVAYAEPDYLYKLVAIPDDEHFDVLYGMHNTGQTGGTADADIDAAEAWDTHTGNKSLLLCIIDTGIDYDHPDLAANMWVNPGEIPGNGIDDDGNGFVDDVHGYDFINYDGDPDDDHGHGTHCAGTVAGVGDNGIGVAGVMWNADLMAIKILDAGGSGATSNIIEGIIYANAMGVDLASNSWGGGGYSAAMQDAIAGGKLYIFAAGNDYGNNNDVNPAYPSSYPLDNIIAVAATDHNDALAGFSNYGPTSVDLSAPGVSTYSCAPGGGYQYMSGTSMATPHVSGAAGLVWSKSPSLSVAQIKQIMLDNTDPVASLSGMVLTGGRLNVATALEQVGPQWLTAAPQTPGTLVPGETQDVTVTVDPTGLIQGQWTGEVTLETNDPSNPAMTLQVIADIDGCKSLTAAAALDFGTIWASTDTTIELTLTNSCNDTVTVSGLEFSHAAFSAAATAPVEVLPFGEITLPVTYSPIEDGTHSGTLTIQSDADDNPVITINLSGEATSPPTIAVSPSSFNENVNPGDTLVKTLTIENSGGAPLECSLEITQSLEIGNILSDSVKNAIRSAAGKNTLAGSLDEAEVVKSVMRTSEIIDSGSNVLVFRDVLPWGYNVAVPILESLGASVTIAGSSQMSTIDMSPFDLVVIESVQGSSFYTTYQSNIARFEQFLANGGNIQFNACTQGSTFPLPGGMTTAYQTSTENYVTDPNHPVVVGLDSILVGSSASHVYFQNIPADASIITVNMSGSPTTVEYAYGNGIILATGMTWEHGYGTGRDWSDILPNALAYSLENSSHPDWLQVSRSSVTVAPDTSIEVDVIFDSRQITAGLHVAAIEIAHNAPGYASPQSVPCTLSIDGFRRLAVSPPAFDFGKVRIGNSSSSLFTLVNEGNEPTTISEVSIVNSEFAHTAMVPLVVAPMDSVQIEVSYQPVDSDSDMTVMEIFSDAEDNPEMYVDLFGIGVTDPSIVVSPSSVSTVAPLNTVIHTNVSMDNTGEDDLHFSVEGTAGGQVIINEFCNNPDFIEVWNRGSERDLSGWTVEWVDSDATSGSFTIPNGYVLGAGKRFVLRENTGTANDSTFYAGFNIGWVSSSNVSVVLLDANGDGVDFVRTAGSTTTPPAGLNWAGGVPFSSVSAFRHHNEDTDSASDWSNSAVYTMYDLNPGQSETSLWPQWLTVSPASDTIIGGASRELVLEFNTTDLAIGTYETTMRIIHDGTNEPSPLEIPVTLTVMESTPQTSKILSVGPSASLPISGGEYMLKDITIGSPSSGTAQGSRYKLILK